MKKILFYLQLAFILLCFFIIYNLIDHSAGKYILILMLLPVSLLFAQIYKLSAIVFIFTAIFISILTFGFDYNTLIISVIFLSLIPVLYIFFRQTGMQHPNMQRKNNELKFYKEELLNEETSLTLKRENLEKKLERIMHFYMISKDLTKNIIAEDAANALSNVLSTRTGVCYTVVISKVKEEEDLNNFKILSRLSEDKKQKWNKLIKDNKEIENLSVPTAVDSLFSIEEKPVIAWPIIIDNRLISCTFLIVEPDFLQTYIEEGEFFLPHLKLGTKRIILFAELKEKARIDGLTGLYLKRYFIEKLYSEIQRAKRYKTDFYLIMLDIDFFKKINDTYGHLTGDKVLKETAKIIKKSVRPGDLTGRYGGEEFIILLPILSEEKALATAENIKNSIKEIIFKENDKSFSITASIGIAKYANGKTSDVLIDNADKALYKAKQTGRNKIVIFKED